MRSILIALWMILAASAALADPAQIILLRHAEKPDNDSDPHLSAAGRTRAQALVDYLTTTPAFTNHGPPAALFACQVTPRGHGRRCLETLQPLAIHLRMSIDTSWPASDYTGLAQHVRGDDRYDGKTVIICWVHDYLPELAKALGLRRKPSAWRKDVFDRVWVITYRGHEGSLNVLTQPSLRSDVEGASEGVATEPAAAPASGLPDLNNKELSK